MPSWRQWLGGFLACLGLSSLFLAVAYAATDIPDDLNTYATQQDNVYFWADGTPDGPYRLGAAAGDAAEGHPRGCPLGGARRRERELLQ